VRGWLRLSYLTGRFLSRLGLRPGMVTMAGVVLSAAVPVAAIYRGPWLFAAAALVLLAALADSADGAVAVMTNRTSRLGAFDDSVADRITEAAWLLALWLVGAQGLLVAASGALAWLHEYIRARSIVAGMTGIGMVTTAERPTRVIVAFVALVVGGVAWFIDPKLTPGAVTVALAVWALLGLAGTTRLLTAVRATLRQSHSRDRDPGITTASDVPPAKAVPGPPTGPTTSSSDSAPNPAL
jgi:phosphatidylglycerophosphate synthase